MYKQSSKSETLDESDDVEEVWNLIHDRLEARRVRDFDVADIILDHLYEEYRISVDDQLRQWSAGGEFDVNVNKSQGEEGSNPQRTDSPTTPDGRVNSPFVRVYNMRGGAGHLSNE